MTTSVLERPVVGAVGPSLVEHGITQQSSEHLSHCQQGTWVRGECQHGTQRWVSRPCKRRTCPVCGQKRLSRMAYRIGYGLDVLGAGSGGWFVGTWARDIDKKTAIKTVGKFVRWLRSKQPGLQYASTWEVTKRGRLHVNLILVPWSYVPQKILGEKWHGFGGGRVVWIQRVEPGIGVEVSKSKLESVPSYVSKWKQMVLSGRGVTYSLGFPKLPDNTEFKRRGQIHWLCEHGRWARDLAGDWHCVEEPLRNEVDIFLADLGMGYWSEVGPGEYAFTCGEDCDCFEILRSERSPPAVQGGVV